MENRWFPINQSSVYLSDSEFGEFHWLNPTRAIFVGCLTSILCHQWDDEIW